MGITSAVLKSVIRTIRQTSSCKYGQTIDFTRSFHTVAAATAADGNGSQSNSSPVGYKSETQGEQMQDRCAIGGVNWANKITAIEDSYNCRSS